MTQRTALVTGAASGIGLATARMLARSGHRVALADLDHGAAEARARELGDPSSSIAIELDVRSEPAWQAALQKVTDAWSRLDVLVNCAGITDEAPLHELSLEQWRRVLSVNLDGVFLGTAAAIRAMSQRGEGAIVNVSSVSGIKASAGAAAYCTSKAGILQLTRVAALECAEAGWKIRVNAVAPGGVKTPMWQTTPLWPAISESPEWTASDDAPALKRFAEADEVAEVIVWLTSSAARYISGVVLPVDGGGSAG